MLSNKNILYVFATLFLIAPTAFAKKTMSTETSAQFLERFGIKNIHTIKNETNYPATLKLFFKGKNEPLEIQLKRNESTTLPATTLGCLEKVEFTTLVVEVEGGKYSTGAQSKEATFSIALTLPKCASHNFIISLKAYTELISPTPYLRRNSLQFALSVTAKNASIKYEAMSNKEIFEFSR